MANTNARLSNHLAAPVTASFCAAMRQAFGKIEVTYVNEGPVKLGSPTVVTDSQLVSYSCQKTVKGKAVYSSVSYMIGTAK